MFEAPKRRVNRVFIHCSASEVDITGPDLVLEIDRWHRNRKPPFSEIGYHFVIDKLGDVLPGRSLEKKPAAQAPHNTATIAICVHGLVFPPNWYGRPQAAALKGLCEEINLAYSGVIAFWPHNAVSSKSCPVFNEAKLLGLDRFRRMP